jgi:outer membrane protein assembly factor BamB
MLPAVLAGALGTVSGQTTLPIRRVAAPAATGPRLGSADFTPSPNRPVGWRGDGTGRFPAATPPIAWQRKQAGADCATKGIVWMTPLPNTSVSSPIIVGDRIFVTAEVSDLVCLDKRTGRVLWIRSNPEFERVPAGDRKANPAYVRTLDPLVPQLVKANADAVKTLNALRPTAAARPGGSPAPALVRKRELDKEIYKLQRSADRKRFDRNWAQEVFGFSGPTPTSDGQHVYVFFTTGVVACYDLEGNRKWINRGGTGMSEHGNFASPLLCENRLVVWAAEMRGYDSQTGKLLWTNPAEGGNTYGSLFRIRAGNEQVAAFQSGFFARISDGKPIWGERVFGDAVATPIAQEHFVFAWVGYPRNSEKLGFKAYRVPASTEGKWPAAAYAFPVDWASDQLPEDKKRPFERSYTASPLYVDGLIYQMTQGGGLMVHDAATGEPVYRKVLSMKPHTEYWGWAGASASPTLAGNYVYLMDNQGTTIVIKPGKRYVEVAHNVIEESGDGKTQVQNVSTPIFEGTRMYYRTPGYLYCIGDK